MELRILTKDNIDEVIKDIKSITIVGDVIIVRANFTYTYLLQDLLFYQSYNIGDE